MASSLRKQIKDALVTVCQSVNLGTVGVPINPTVFKCSDEPSELPAINIWPPTATHVRSMAPGGVARELVFVVTGHADYETTTVGATTTTREEKIDAFMKRFETALLAPGSALYPALSTNVELRDFEEIDIKGTSLVWAAEVAIQYQYRHANPDTVA